MYSTTPVKLVTIGAVPARDGGLSGGVAPSVVEVLPGVFLLATIVRAKNQCILELIQPADTSSNNTLTSPMTFPTTTTDSMSSCRGRSALVVTSASTSTSPSSSLLAHRKQPDCVPCSSEAKVPAVAVPMALKSGFRVPRVIQLVAEDEGVIETVALVREPLGTAFVAALEDQKLTASNRSLRGCSTIATKSTTTASSGAVHAATEAASSASNPSVHHVHIHFFIGTSNGTVIIGNALRGTILAVAQFQYHHLFTSELRDSRSTTTSTSLANGAKEQNSGDADSTQGDKEIPAKNQAVVKFVVREKHVEQLWNPTLPLSQENSPFTSQNVAVSSSKERTTAAAVLASASPTVGSRLNAVYVVHSGGKVVELTRAALDVFVRCSVDRLDGHRPHLMLEWEPDTSPSPFPVAGPASDFAAHVGGVFVLEPPSDYSPTEKCTAAAKTASPESTRFSIRDAGIVTEMPGNATPSFSSSSSALLAPLEAQRRPCELLLIGGSSPLFSFYRLQPPSTSFSAINAVKAVKKMVTGMAHTLWFSVLSTTTPAERPPHLKKIATPGERPFLQADAKCVGLQVDPSQQWAAFAVEGGGRIYVADVQTGVMSGVLKGCRAAQFTWWWTDSVAGRPSLLLVVYLPLRRAVEVYTVRTWGRLAACHVPEGCVLLRTCGVPHAQGFPGGINTSIDTIDNRCLHGIVNNSSGVTSKLTTTCSGYGCGALLMDPAGTVYEVRIEWSLNEEGNNACLAMASTPPLSVETAPASKDEMGLLSASELRGCQTPDDFITLALQLPLPQPYVELEDGSAPLSTDRGTTTLVTYAVKGGDEVRRYGKSLELLCSTVQRRFAPGYAEIAVTPLPCNPQQLLEGSPASVPHNTTAAQCLHFVRLYRSLTEGYYSLLGCRRVGPLRYFDPAQWTSGLVTPELWSQNFSMAASAGGAAASPSAAFVKQIEERMSTLLTTFPAEQSIFKKHFSGFLRQVLRRVPAFSEDVMRSSASTPAPLADPRCCCFLPLPTFLRCFYCGTARPSFLSGAIAVAEDADGSVNFLGPFSDLIFGQLGLDGFFAQLPTLTEIGCTDRDLALLTLTWIARQGGRNLNALFTTTTVGLFAAALLTFQDDHFLHALDRAPIPFISVEGDIAIATVVGSITSLLWCCAMRCTLRPSPTVMASQRFTRRVRQLLQLWYAFTKGAVSSTVAEASETCCGAGTDGRIAFSLRLGSVEPPSLPLTTQTSKMTISSQTSVAAFSCTAIGRDAVHARSGGDTTNCTSVSPTEGDTFEVYLQRNGISISLLDNFTVPRAEADAEAVRNLPLFSTFISSLGATEHMRIRNSSGTCNAPDVVESLPWIEAYQWEQGRFHNEVTKPLEKLWQQMTVETAGKTASRSPRTRLRERGGAANKEGRSSIYTSCLLLVAMSVLEHAMRPLTDVSFFFWDNNAIPDGNFFPVDGKPQGLILSGSRTSREYLKSLQELSGLVETMVQQTVTPLENADRVLLIQHISMALFEDDALLFPLIPNFLRVRLTIWMQVLARAPHAPLRRVQRVSRLVSLLLFFSEASALTAGGVALTQLQSQMTVPWTDLIGGANRRDQLRLLPDVFIADVAPQAQESGLALSDYAVDDESLNSAPLHPGVAATVLRRFLVAAGVLYAQQHGQLMVTSAFPPAPCLGLVADDTRQCLARLAHCLSLHKSPPDIADIVLMDYEIKHLFPVAFIEQEMLLLSTKAAAPHIGFTVLQCFLVQILQYVMTQRKTLRQHRDSALYEIVSEQLHRLVGVLSPESRAWLQLRETEMMTATVASANAERGEDETKTSSTSITASASKRASATAQLSDSSLLLCDSSWVSVTEYQDMRRLVFLTLALPKGTPERKNFYRVLFTLSQWACEGRLMLPTPIQHIARELPMIVENWEKIA